VLEHFGARRIALATRWPQSVNDALTRYLADAGIEVLACRARPRTLDENKHAEPAADHILALELGREALEAAPAADALLLPGGLWFAIYAVPILESQFGRPVLLNILSTTWAALHADDRPLQQRPDPRWGKVMASLK
jgi:maleate cis-trans isomerase